MADQIVPVCSRRIAELLPIWLQYHLAVIHRELGGELYLAGGVVRDLLLSHASADIDLTVNHGARAWAARLAALSGGTLVALGRIEEAARVVCRGVTVDFSSFRLGAHTIAEDLVRRDLTINALAVPFDSRGAECEGEAVPIDPTGGLDDLRRGLIRMASPESFVSDPLRLLRAVRFAVTLGYAVEPITLELMRQQSGLVVRVASERIAHELELIMASADAHAAFGLMAACGLLWAIVPELQAGVGMAQPSSHHLDVWGHSLETLHQMEGLLAAPGEFFPGPPESIRSTLSFVDQSVRLKWAALLHDLGKPATHALRSDKGGRITFYNHDQVGARQFDAVALRLKWSNAQREQVARWIGGHMQPFHLANVARSGNLTLRAAIRMIRRAGADLPGLFLLAMADSLAGQGSERIKGMEEELAGLYAHLERVRDEHVVPVRSAPPLLTGRELIEQLHLAPGPVFKRILVAVEEARMAGEVGDAEAALELARRLALASGEINGTNPR